MHFSKPCSVFITILRANNTNPALLRKTTKYKIFPGIRKRLLAAWQQSPSKLSKFLNLLDSFVFSLASFFFFFYILYRVLFLYILIAIGF